MMSLDRMSQIRAKGEKGRCEMQSGAWTRRKALHPEEPRIQRWDQHP